MPERRGVVDTSVLIDLERIPAEHLPEEMAIAAISLAELAAGPHATSDAAERARRQQRLQRAEATFSALPFDVQAARAYGQVYAALTVAGRKARGRAADLFIAATAVSAGVAIYTRNVSDFSGLESIVKIVQV